MGPPRPKRIKHRIFGVETECSPHGLTHDFEDVRRYQERILPILFPDGPSRNVARSGHHFLDNQGKTNFEAHTGVWEISTPETIGAKNIALQETSSLQIFAHVASELKRLFPEEYGKLSLHKADRNCQLKFNGAGEPIGLSTGGNFGSSHGNYGVLTTLTVNGLRKLDLFRKTRWTLIGNGMPDIDPRGLLKYTLSQRVGLIYIPESPSSNNAAVPILGIKCFRSGYHLARDTQPIGRHHDPSENQNMSEVQLFLKRITMDIMLALIEDEDFLTLPPPIDDPRLERGNELVEVLNFFNADLFGQRTVRLADGQNWSAVNFQRHFLAEAERYFREGRGSLTAERKEGLELWSRVLDALEREDLEELARILDWAAVLYYIYMPRLEKFKIDPERLISTEPSAGIKPFRKIDTRRGKETLLGHFLYCTLQFANVETEKSLYGNLVRTGRMEKWFTKEQLLRASQTPPVDTVANYRRELIEWVRQRPEVRLKSWDWERITIAQDAEILHLEVISYHDCLDPHKAKVKELGKENVTPEMIFKNGTISIKGN